MKSMYVKIVVCMLLTAGFAGCASAQSGGYSCAITPSHTDFVDTIRTVWRGGLLTVPVTINGEERFFLFDTGASMAVVYADQPVESAQPVTTVASRDAIGRMDTVQVVALPTLTIGKTKLSGCRATVQRRAVNRHGIDGILGFDIVNSGLLMKIDVAANRLIITDRRQFFDGETSDNKLSSVGYKLRRHVPYIPVQPFYSSANKRVKRFSAEALFDTGSRQFFALNHASLKSAEAKDRKGRSTEDAHSVGSQVRWRTIGRHSIGFSGAEPRGEVACLGLDCLAFGSISFHDVDVMTTQGDSHIGAALLRKGAVILDPYKKTLFFSPYPESQDSSQISERPPFVKAIINDGGRPVVGLVSPVSKAYEAGLREGDIIISADGVAINSFSDYVAFRPLHHHVYTFVVFDKRGFRKEVRMEW